MGRLTLLDCPSCRGTGDRPTVTDAQVEAAQQASYDPYMGEMGPKVDSQTARRMIRAALEAAARVEEKG